MGSVKLGVGTGVVVGGIILVVRGSERDMTDRDSVLVDVIVTLNVSVSECVGDSSSVRESERSSVAVNVTVRVSDFV